MAFPLSVTVADYVYHDIIEGSKIRPKKTSRSEWVEELLIKGHEAKLKEGGNDGAGSD